MNVQLLELYYQLRYEKEHTMMRLNWADDIELTEKEEDLARTPTPEEWLQRRVKDYVTSTPNQNIEQLSVAVQGADIQLCPASRDTLIIINSPLDKPTRSTKIKVPFDMMLKYQNTKQSYFYDITYDITLVNEYDIDNVRHINITALSITELFV